MSFFVVQTRKTNKSKPCLTVVPSKWVKNKVVYWPPNNLTILSKNKDSLPDESNWKQQKCKVVAKAATFEQAEDALQKLETVTDSEDAVQMTMGTRLHPPKKKQKFVSKSYKLAPPMPKQLTAPLLTEDSGNITSSAQVNTQLVMPDAVVDVENEKHIYAKALETADQHRTHNTAAEGFSSSSARPPIPEVSSKEITQMWNIVTSVDGRQYLQIADGSYVEIAMQPTAEAFTGNAQEIQPDNAPGIISVNTTGCQAMNEIEPQPRYTTEGQPNITAGMKPLNDTTMQPIYAAGMHSISAAAYPLVNTAGSQLINGDFQPIMKEIEQAISVDDSKVKGENKLDTSEQLGEIIARLDRMEPVLEKIVYFMADVDRFMKLKSSDHVEIPGKRNFQEDFSEFECFFPIYTEEQLLTLEISLNNQDTNNKLFHYFESVYNLNGKRDSGPFFKALLRKILVPSTIQMYSWKGQSRNNKGEPKTANKSFKDTFPLFVKFVHRVVRAADYEFTEEANSDAFSVYLRNKNTEIQRHEKGCGEQRVARVRRKRTPKPVDAAADDLMDTDNSCSVPSSEDSNDCSNGNDFV